MIVSDEVSDVHLKGILERVVGTWKLPDGDRGTYACILLMPRIENRCQYLTTCKPVRFGLEVPTYVTNQSFIVR